MLATHFLRKYSQENARGEVHLSPEAMKLLTLYAWPGNVRELENAIERAVVVTQADRIAPESFALNQSVHGDAEDTAGKPLKEAVNVFKKHYIRQTLDMNQWNQTKTARLLGIQRTYLSRLIKELGIGR
jgi:Nif-specific regulatory protein